MARTEQFKKLLQRSLLLGLIALWGLLGLLPDCLLLKFIKIPCLFCGMTRSAEALLHLDWQTSLRFHPLTIPFCISVFILVNRDVFSISDRVMRVWVGLLAALFVLVWLVRLSSGPAGWAFLLPIEG